MPFAPVNDQQIREMLRIDDVSIEQGRLNKPEHTDTALDPTQLAIVQKYNESLDSARNLVVREARDVHGKLHKLSVELDAKPYAAHCKQIPSQLQGQLIQITSERRSELRRARVAERRLMRDLNFFRIKNNLNREAHYPDSGIFYWSIIFAMIVTESLSNAYFFAEGSSLGYTGGWLQSIIVSLLVIVVSSTLVGGHLIPQLYHIEVKRNVLGAIGLAICVSALLLLILLVGHYRHLLVTDPDNALNQALPHLKEGMFALDPMSLLFCGVSIAFAISAAIYGFRADDPYPGYGDLDRRYRRVEQVYEADKKTLGERNREAINSARTKIAALESEVQARVQEHGMLVPQVQALILEFNNYADGLEERCNTLLTVYRSRNRQIRTEPSPTYFANRYTFADRERISPPELSETNGLLSRFAALQSEVFSVASLVRDEVNVLSKLQDESLTTFINEIEADANRSLDTDARTGE